MDKLTEVLQKAEFLKKNNNYSEALELFKSIIDVSYKDLSSWEKYCYAYCLEKNGLYEESIEVCRDIWKHHDKNLIYNNKLYALCIYMSYLRKESESGPKETKKAIEGIISLVEHKDFPQLGISIFHAIDKLSDQVNPDYSFFLYLLDHLNTDLLKKECLPNINEQNKKTEYASDLETYYSKKTNCLLESKKYQECIEYCEIALTSIYVMHNNNDVWFKRRKAMSLAELGNLDDALSIYQEIVLRKAESFIFKEMADIYIKKNEMKIAKDYIGKGILCFGDFEYKIELLHQAYVVLLYLLESDIALVHLRVYVLVRKKNKWRTASEIEALTKNFPDEVNDIQKLSKQIETYWSSNYLKEGTVKTIVSDYGWISCENQDYYFRLKNVKSRNRSIAKGDKVTFRLTSAYDKKKNKKVENAIDILIK